MSSKKRAVAKKPRRTVRKTVARTALAATVFVGARTMLDDGRPIHEGYAGSAVDALQDALGGGGTPRAGASTPAVAATSVNYGPARYIPRSEWEVTPRDLRSMPNNGKGVRYVFIHDTASTASAEPIATMRNIDHYHGDTKGWSGGFAYTFAVFPNGTVAEGRGWGTLGAHTVGRWNGEVRDLNPTSYGIAIDGEYDTRRASPAAIQSVISTIKWGIEQGYISPDVQIFGHREANRVAGLPGESTQCPGDALFAQLGTVRASVARFVANRSAGRDTTLGMDFSR